MRDRKPYCKEGESDSSIALGLVWTVFLFEIFGAALVLLYLYA